MKITAEDIQALNPCSQWYSKIPHLVGKGMTPRQIALTSKVDAEWRYWVLTSLLARTAEGKKSLVLWACGIAQTVTQDDAGQEAIGLAISWAMGMDDVGREDLNTAANTAAYAASDAAAYAASASYYASYASCAAAAANTAAYAAYAAASYAEAAASDAYYAYNKDWLLELAARVEAES